MAISSVRAILLGFPAFGLVMTLPIVVPDLLNGVDFPEGAGPPVFEGVPLPILVGGMMLLAWIILGLIIAGIVALFTRKKKPA